MKTTTKLSLRRQTYIFIINRYLQFDVIWLETMDLLLYLRVDSEMLVELGNYLQDKHGREIHALGRSG